MMEIEAERRKEVDDGPERLANLSAREVQEALAIELGDGVDEDAGDADDLDEDLIADALEDDDDDAAESVDGDVDDEAAASAAPSGDGPSAVATAAEAAVHLRMLEALLFAAPEPLDAAAIAKRLPAAADVPALIETLTQHYENRGVQMSEVGGRYRFVTNPEVAHILVEERVETRKLTRAATETLAIIAYHQPCTRADIEDVRGVAVSKGSLDQLLEMGWVRLAGRRRDSPGRPVLYATTPAFLEHFNLGSVSDLPGMADLKAAGLLEANLPPGFSVPLPQDAVAGEDGEDADEGDDGATPEFVQDFHDDADPDVGPDAELDADPGDATDEPLDALSDDESVF